MSGPRVSHASEPALEGRAISVRYGDVVAIDDVTARCAQGTALAVLGANAAGKSSLLKALAGVVGHDGDVVLVGRGVLPPQAHRRVDAGVSLVPEQRQVFADMTVEDNLLLGAFRRREGRRARDAALAGMLELFPQLVARRHVAAGYLSGGEQQMVAIARGLMAQPKVLLMDEPTLGLAPRIVEELGEVVRTLAARLDGLVIAEQNVRWATEVCSDVIALQRGRVALTGAAAAVRDDPRLQAICFGGATEAVPAGAGGRA